MAAVRLSRSQLPILLQKLNHFYPDNIKICGELKCKLENRSKKLSGFDFLVDSWPNFSTVIWRPDDNNNRLKFVDNHHSVLTSNHEKLRQMLKNSDLIKWKSPIVQFADVREELYDVISEAAEKHGFCTKLSFKYLAVSVNRKNTVPVPEEFVMRPLSVHHAGIVMKNVEYSGEGGIEYCEELIKHYLSLALFDKGDNLVAFILETNYGTTGMLAVIQNYRNKNLTIVLMSHFNRLLEENGQMAVGWINAENYQMRNLLIKWGASVAPQKYIWIDCFKK